MLGHADGNIKERGMKLLGLSNVPPSPRVRPAYYAALQSVCPEGIPNHLKWDDTQAA